MQRIFILILLLLPAVPGTAQQVFGNAGDHFANAQTDLAFTFGEAIIGTVSNGSQTATQGFQQPIEVGIATHVEGDGATDVLAASAVPHVYPNPLQEELHIWLPEGALNRSFELYNMAGQLLRKGNLEPGETTIPMDDAAPGSYLITILNRFDDSAHSFRLIKH